MKEKELIVMKFGGSSVENADRFNHAAKIIASYTRDYKVVVVVSAIYRVTNRLVDIVEGINLGHKQQVIDRVDSLYQLHLEAAQALDLHQERPLVESINGFRSDLLSFNKQSLSHPSEEDFILSYGERLSYQLLSGTVSKLGVNSQEVDAAKVIATNNEYGNAKAYLDISEIQAKEHINPLIENSIVPVIGGFYGLSREERIAVLGRGGSDYTASIMANILNANRLILWKEVDGVYSSDPKTDPLAEFLPFVSYEYMEYLAKVIGAKILHPESIEPLKAKNILVEVRNFDKPDQPGSWIGSINMKGGDKNE